MSFPTVIAMYNYDPVAPDDLPLAVGDHVKVIEKSSNGWWRGEGLSGNIGWFPSTYVTEAETSMNGDQAAADDEPQPIEASQAKPGKIFFALVNSQVYDDLVFAKGEKLQVIGEEVEDGGWIKVKNGQNKEGNVQFQILTAYDMSGPTTEQFNEWASAEIKPTMLLSTGENVLGNQVDFQAIHQLRNPKEEQKTTMRLLQSTNTPQSELYECIYSFNAGAEGQISINHKEQIQVLSLLEVNSEWAQGNNDIQSAPGLPVPLTSMEKEGFFFGQMQREYAESCLELAQEGQFLVRNSERYPGSYTLSMKGFDNVEHFRMEVVEGQLKMNGRTFRNMQALMSHHKRRAILKSGENFLYMEKPLSP
ncbi:hypothetical protein CAEBREN_10806 [Caenorhabditis brenneri]|uniref:Uncharacterized protein n=1 Tax=Caenorhabditis brenneri TaxID=135651 RepID=G0M869_CAEBE|nr:hypothetical protein CAEBREN_10806 [Caenorhabditis brenneri]